MSAAELSALVKRLEAVTTRLENVSTSSGGGEAQSTSELVESFDQVVLEGKFKTYLELSNKIGGEVTEQSLLVKAVFQHLRGVLVTVSKHKAPKPDKLGAFLKPLSDKVNAVITYCEKRRTSKYFNNLMTVKEGIGCAGWVSVSPKPAPYVKECGDQALFYGNRVIKEYKGKDDQHVSWVRAYQGAITELQNYVKTHHTTGLVWNKEGAELSVAPPPLAAAGPPPPPPPAVLPPTDAPAPSKGGSSDAAKANLFADLNKGASVTSGLKKVTDDMKTHKNPNLRDSSFVKATETKAVSKPAPKFGAAAGAKKPVLALQGKKWVVEYQDDKPWLGITEGNAKQTIYVYKCNRSTLKVSNKVNSIIIDSCKRMSLVFDDVISSAEVINSQGVQIQVLGKCPTVSIDKTDGCQVFLSKDSLDCEFITAKSSEMNISIPPKSGKGDFSEHPIAEQFRTKWNGTSLVTDCTDITS